MLLLKTMPMAQAMNQKSANLSMRASRVISRNGSSLA
jgi:hypothetical protein